MYGSDSLLNKTRRIMEMIQEGQFVEGMEQFYADSAVNEEATGDRVEGKTAIIANERKFLEQVSDFHGVSVRAIGVGEDDGKGNGVTFAEYSIRADLKDGKQFNPDQVQVTRWKDGEAVLIRFYYNPDF